MVLAEPLLQVWLGAALDPQSIAVARIVLAGFWVNGIANVPYALIQARGNPRFTALLHVAELPFYMAALYLLGMQWGLPGLAAAFSLRCLADMIVLLRAGHGWTGQVVGRLALPALAIALVLGLSEALHGWKTSLAVATVLGSASLAYAIRFLPGDMARPILSLVQRIVPFRRWAQACRRGGEPLCLRAKAAVERVSHGQCRSFTPHQEPARVVRQRYPDDPGDPADRPAAPLILACGLSARQAGFAPAAHEVIGSRHHGR